MPSSIDTMAPAKITYAKPYAVLVTICLIALISVAGVALPYPILAPIFADPVLGPFNHWQQLPPKLLLGIALAANPLGILLGSAILGALSDQFDRRKVLALALVGAIIGYLLSALAIAGEQYLWFVVARWLTGLCEGSVSICRAIAADLHPQIDRTKAISWMNSALYAAWLVGPLVGGLSMHLGADVPFLLAAGAMLPCLALLYFYLPASTAVKAESQPLWRHIRAHNSLRLIALPALKWVVLSQFLYTVGLNAFYEYYPLWLVENEQFNSWHIGLITAALCAVMTSVSAFGMSNLSQRLSALPAAAVTAVGFALLLVLLPFCQGRGAWLVLVLCGVPIAMVSAWFQVYCANQFEYLGLGRVMGLLTLLMCAGNMLIALLGAVIALWGTSYTLWTGALCILMAAAAMFYQHRRPAL